MALVNCFRASARVVFILLVAVAVTNSGDEPPTEGRVQPAAVAGVERVRESVDPTNMLNFDDEIRAKQSGKAHASADVAAHSPDDLGTTELRKILAECRLNLMQKNAELNEACSKCTANGGVHCKNEVAIVKSLVRHLLMRLPKPRRQTTFGKTFVGEITIGDREISKLKHFLAMDSSDTKSATDVLLYLDNALSSVEFVSLSDRIKKGYSHGGNLLVNTMPWLNLAVLAGVTSHLIVQVFRKRVVIIILWFLVSCFLVSFAWTWCHMYKSKVAETAAKLRSISPDSCNSVSQLNPWQVFTVWLKNMVGTMREDPCLQLQKASMIDPFWEVKPLQVLVVTVTEFILEPFDLIASKFSSFYVRLLRDVPILHQPFVWLAFLLFFTIILLFLCGYRVRAFFGLLCFEPSEYSIDAAGRPVPVTEGGLASIQPIEDGEYDDIAVRDMSE